MITRITKQNRAKYEQLFADANKILGENIISSLEDYFSNIEFLMDESPKFVRLPVDEDFFAVDLNTRKITIPSSFKTVGLGVQGDKFAEVIYFKVDRYFDTTDLNDTQIYILWENSKGQKYFDSAYRPDATTETDKVIFGWGIGEEITQTPGNIKFSVIFIDGTLVAEENVLVNIATLNYRLGTLPTTITVNAGLVFDVDLGVNVIDSSNELRKRIKNSKPIGDIPEAKEPIIIEYNGYDWSKDKTCNLVDLLDDSLTVEEEYGLTALAYSPEAGIITYKWYKGENKQNAEMLGGSYSHLLVSGNRVEDRVYYTPEGKDEYRIITETDDWDSLMEDNAIFERVGFCKINKPGKYFVEIINKAGRAISSLIPDGRVIIPGPTPISKVEITVKNGDEIFVEGEELVLVANVTDSSNDDTIYYLWNNGSTEPELKIDSAGTYSVDVWSSRNGETTVENKVNASINIYAAAISPSSVAVVANAYIDEDKTIALLSKDLLLTVSYNEITQEGSSIKVQWQWQSLDGGEWINLDGMSSNTLVPSKTGVYRAVVTNEISSGNSVSVESNSIFVFSKE